MSVETCARLIVAGTAARGRNIMMSRRDRLGLWLKLLAPTVVDKMALAALKREPHA